MEENQFPDLEMLELRQRVKELEGDILQLKSIGAGQGVKTTSDSELICAQGIRAILEMQKKNGGYIDLEHTKILDLLHKNLLQAQGKQPVEEKKKKDRIEPAKLLQMIKDLPKEGER